MTELLATGRIDDQLVAATREVPEGGAPRALAEPIRDV
jgi:hypothetical protein